MRVTTVQQLSVAISERRKQLGLTQQELAERTGVGRQWINEVERGKPAAQLYLILDLLDALGLKVEVSADV
ncbi:type II toxin-antitoxin system Y4mF family antitoxin [Corynebacterium sp. H130]|uniref:type II toxin-antitoxin system Y4mF family antitoxin n=1 Tax=Corynebacterium sp. H130 TaxID=3133444 RepID=UPI0030B48FBD